MQHDAIADFYLTSLVGGQGAATMRRYPGTADARQALGAGGTMAAMGAKAELEAGLTDALAVHSPPLPGFAVGTWTVGGGVHFAYCPLAYAVDDVIAAAVADGGMAAIFATHGLTFSPPALLSCGLRRRFSARARPRQRRLREMKIARTPLVLRAQQYWAKGPVVHDPFRRLKPY